jgi:nucleotide-binding universal stress UspA family protein
MTGFSAHGPRVVVGIDGSEWSREVLLFAAGEARMRGLPLHVVTAYRPDIVGPVVVEVIDHRDDYVTMLRGVLGECGRALDGIEVHADVVLGSAAETLVAASRDATLLVVGDRGYGGVTRLLLGSTSHAVVRRASCPVVVVHRPPMAEPAEAAVPEPAEAVIPAQRLGSDVIAPPLL